jgi:hypothetical protein
MIVTTLALLLALGFAAFVLGNVLGYQGIAMIGAVLIVGAGAAVADGGIETKSGVTVETTSANTTVETYQYQTSETPVNLPFGGLVMLLGGVLALRSIDTGGR